MVIPPMIDTAPTSDLFRLIADSAPVLIWMAGPDKLCCYFNKTWLDFTGRSLEQGMETAGLKACIATIKNGA